MVIRVLLFLIMSTLSYSALAVAFVANVDRSTVSEGESILLTVKYNSNVFSGNPDLTSLEKDFEVISQNRKSNFQFINGQSNSWTIWTIAIIPKGKGKFIIPSISFKGESTKPIEVNVTKVSDAIKNQQKNVFFHTEVDIKTTYVQAQIIYTEKLYFSVQLDNGQLDDVRVDEAVVEQLGNTTHYTTQLNGKTYGVYERKTAIFPQVSGEMVIPGPRYTGEISNGYYGGGRPIAVSHPPLRLQILPKPASYPSNEQWIAAEELTLNYDWRGNPQELKVGEPITLDLTLHGKGVSSAQLPNLELANINGLKYYPDQSQPSDHKEDSGFTGVRKQSTAIVATKNGHFTLPEIRVPWWNTKRQQLEFAVLPAQRLSSTGMVKSNTQPEPKAENTESDIPEENVPTISESKSNKSSNVWMAISSVLFLLWLGTLYLWITARRNSPIETSANPTTKASDFSNKRLKLACRANSPEEARIQILLWAKHQWQKSYSSLTEVAHLCGDEALSSALLELDYTLYSETGNSAWQGEYLWQLIDGYKGKASDSKGELPPLYPA